MKLLAKILFALIFVYIFVKITNIDVWDGYYDIEE